MTTATASHYHAIGEAEDLGKKPGSKLRGPENGCCRCEAHIAAPLKATRQRPNCALPCYMCERFSALVAKGYGR
jgi:hypothetical protein